MLMKQRKGKGRASKPPPSAAADRGAAADDADDSDDADDAPPLPETAKPPTAPPKKRGKFDPLGDTAASRRYAKETLKHDDYRGSGLSHGNPTARHQRARKAAAASHAPREIVFDDDRDTIVERDARGQVSSEMHAARRYAICYVYETVSVALPRQHERDTRYALKLVGDSPELCRALDAHGFADLGNAINYHVSVSCSQYAVGDTRRFEMGTPAQVWSTMSRCWTVAPTSARIIEDIDALPGVLEKIIAANGCVVHDEFLRTGRRAVSRDGARLTRNARSRQRIETCRACPRHPDIEAALTELRANLQGRAVRQRP